MAARVTRHGDNLAVVIEPGLLRQLGLDEDAELEVTTDGTSLILTPVHADPEMDEAMEFIDLRYGRAMKRLAE